MSSNEVVKSVAKKLKYYFEVKRLEDGFDLSDIHQPQLDHPPLKSRPALQYDGLHDRALKHYFSQPEVRVQLTQLNGPNAKGSLHSRRELAVRKMLDSYMKHYTFQAECIQASMKTRSTSPKRSPLPSCYYLYSYSGNALKPEVTGVLQRRKKKSPQQGDLRLSGPPSGQGAGSGARTRDRRVPADLRADSQATVLPTPPDIHYHVPPFKPVLS
ncbi:ankyrin-3 [Plakobranchus ocellatus]|uniref:Ankyrin-3 n=1 Tax=Plakobranchus ocellatus TaxID=259542 RepID=A0AAV3ZNY5_9GAST|nr:ankyrin-3 [Plakobranchus ocellatus]